MNTREKRKIATYIKLSEQSRAYHLQRLKESPHDFNAYVREQYDLGVLVGLKMALDAQNHP